MIGQGEVVNHNDGERGRNLPHPRAPEQRGEPELKGKSQQISVHPTEELYHNKISLESLAATIVWMFVECCPKPMC